MAATVPLDFEALVGVADDALDLAQIGLAIAADAYPGLDADIYLARLDAIAAAAAHAAGPGATTAQLLAALDHELYEVEGFAGNEDAYYDPRNSFLNDVLDRRLGIPITLSVIYLEVGWRLGLPLEPVSFPSHFLVATRGAQRVFIDPFNAAKRQTEADLLTRLVPMLGNSIDNARTYLPRATAATSRREVAARILRNLKGIYASSGELAKLLTVSNRMVALDPQDAIAVRDRGQVLAELECHQAAYHDFQHYLRHAPHADDTADIEARLERLRPIATRLH